MVKLLSLIFEIISGVLNMFLTGEKIKDIKSYCLVEYANYFYDKKRFDNALNCYNRAISLNPANHYAYWGVTATLIMKGMFTEALDSCNKGISIKADERLYILQCVIYKALGKSIRSEEVLQRTLKYFNEKVDVAYDTLAHTCYSFNLLDDAEYYAKKAMAINPDEAAIHYNLAKIYSQKHQNQMAKEEFQKVLELSSIDQKKLKHYKVYAQNEIDKIGNL
jgi:tetratricopeptide (TPR) repeat protein